MTNLELKNTLEDIANETENTLEKAVIHELLSQYQDEIEMGFNNIVTYHRSHGMVQSFIFYNEMETFFDTHHEWINDAIFDYEDRHGTPFTLRYTDNLKSELAWIAFQETASRMAYKLELEI